MAETRRNEYGMFLTRHPTGYAIAMRRPPKASPPRPKSFEADTDEHPLDSKHLGPHRRQLYITENYGDKSCACGCGGACGCTTKDDFAETEHPRAMMGKFTSSGTLPRGGGDVREGMRELDIPSMKQGEEDATALVNPSRTDLADYFGRRAGDSMAFRAISNGEHFAVWPADSALPEQVARTAPEFQGGTRHYFIHAKRGQADRSHPYQVGVYAIAPYNDVDKGKVLPPKYVPKGMLRAIGQTRFVVDAAVRYFDYKARIQRTRDDFKEDEHPRGQPDNKGEFVKKGEGSGDVPTRHPENISNVPDERGSIDPELFSNVRETLDRLEKKYPIIGHLPLRAADTHEHALAWRAGNAVHLSEKHWTKPVLTKYEKEWDGLTADPTPEGTITHEFGHALIGVLEKYAGHKAVWDTVYKWLDVGPKDSVAIRNDQTTPYGQENIYEFTAESFVIFDSGGKKGIPDYAPPAFAENIRRISQGMWADLLALPPEKKSNKSRLRKNTKDDFSEADHPRGQPENAGQFVSKGEGVATTSKRDQMLPARREGKELRTHEGHEVPAHIKALRIPPAWTDVMYHPDPAADLLATGKDAAGRLQYVYSERFAKEQSAAKFARIKELESKYNQIQRENNANRASDDPVKRDAADAAFLIMNMGIRPGSETDTKSKVKAYGATTLLGKHVVTDPQGGMRLQFVGKKGVSLDLPVDSKAVAYMLRQRADDAGPDGQLFPRLNEKRLLDYVHSLDGGDFKTKDFRTHLATATAADMVAKLPAPTNEAQYKNAVMTVARAVSARLGNTPTIALQSYIAPHVFADWRMKAEGGSPSTGKEDRAPDNPAPARPKKPLEMPAQQSWEAAPGMTTRNLPEFHNAPLEVRQEYQRAMMAALTDAKGRDVISDAFGLTTKKSFEAPGVFEGRVNPGAQAVSSVRVDGDGNVLPEDKAKLDAAEAVRGALLRQDAAAWHKPTYVDNLAPDRSNMVDVSIGRTLSNDEAIHLADTLNREIGSDFFTPISTPKGFRLLNVPDATGIPNEEFQKKAIAALEKTNLPDMQARPVHADGNYLPNDWKENPNGEAYHQVVMDTGRQDIIDTANRLYADLGPKVAGVEDDFAKRYNWTADPTTRFWQPDGSAGPGRAIVNTMQGRRAA